MKQVLFGIMAGLMLVTFLAACGGGGGGGSSAGASAENAKHIIELVPGTNGGMNALKVQPAIFSDSLVNVTETVDNEGVPTTAKVSDVSEIIVNGVIVGYRSAAPELGKSAAFATVATIEGVALGDVILVQFKKTDGKLLTINPDHVQFTGAPVKVQDGLIRYGVAADNPNFSAPQQPTNTNDTGWLPTDQTPIVTEPVSLNNQVDFVVDTNGRHLDVHIAQLNSNAVHFVRNGADQSVDMSSGTWKVCWNSNTQGKWFPNTPYCAPVTNFTASIPVDLATDNGDLCLVKEGDNNPYWMNPDFVSGSGLTIKGPAGSFSW